MRKGVLIICLSVAVALVEGAAGDENKTLYELDFESAEMTPKECIVSSAQPTLIECEIDREFFVEGKASYYARYSLAGEGHFYPGFCVRPPISLERGPVYFSGYVRIIEKPVNQKEPRPAPRLCCAGSLPAKKDGWKGFHYRSCESVPLKKGWIYFYSDDLSQYIKRYGREHGVPIDGATINCVYLFFRPAIPGDHVSFHLDGIRFSRGKPKPYKLNQRKKTSDG